MLDQNARSTAQEDSSLFGVISQWVEKQGQKGSKPIKLLLVTHRQADPDALCSAEGFSRLTQRAFPTILFETKILVPQGASMLGISVCKQLGINFNVEIQNEEIDQADIIIAVDLGQPELLEPYLVPIEKSRSFKILVDHHSGGSDIGGRNVFDKILQDIDATSTCEIVAKSFPTELFDKQVSEILLVGLLFDSQHLGIATARTLESALKLVRAGAVMEYSKGILRSKPDRSEIIARIKSAQRLQFRECGKYLILEAAVSSFQASVARMMVEIGADLGVAYGKNDKETRISTRSTQRFFKDTGIDLGLELKNIADRRKASDEGIAGGGHSTAASMSGQDLDPSEIVKELMETIRSKLPQT
ncbi:MAG: DHH family phosphoesterase [Nitrososphaerales archaeon]